MTRRGKIARLPLAIREQLNQRLQDGQEGKQIVEWLNSLPKVQAVLKVEFDAQPISENNLSTWKTGGYLTWEQDQATRNALDTFLDKAASLPTDAKESLADRTSLFLAAKIAVELNRLDALPDGEEKSQSWRELLGSFVLLRRAEIQSDRLGLDQQKYADHQRHHRQEEKRREESKAPELTYEEREKRISQILGTE